MYSSLRHVQYLIAGLKEKKIKHIVISPGNSHNAIVRSVEDDSFFKTYSIVDERSAAFFALGLIQELNNPVAIVCTAGTAALNFLSGTTEAYRRNMPLIAITADKLPIYIDQNEDQMINQSVFFDSITKFQVSLPIINDKKDEWYCKRILSEVFLHINDKNTGPVQINVPIEEGMLAIGKSFTCSKLPFISLIDKVEVDSSDAIWSDKIKLLQNKRVAILCGQNWVRSLIDEEILEEVYRKLNCIIVVDNLANINCQGTVNSSIMATVWDRTFLPDIVITLGGNFVSNVKYILKKNENEYLHWDVNNSGKVMDQFRHLSTIFEMSENSFLSKIVEYSSYNNSEYFEYISERCSLFEIPRFEFSIAYSVQKLIENLPDNSVLNIGNSTSIRISQYFPIDKGINVYCNRGINGIDGTVSTFIGQSAATKKLSFIIVGDLAFFYDMNALWNKYVGSNVRILLINNQGASLFHINQGLENYPKLNSNVAAEHFTSAKAWCESLGFQYLSAGDEYKFEENLKVFVSGKSDKPIIFEVFTKKEIDAKVYNSFIKKNKQLSGDYKDKMKDSIKSVLGGKNVKRLKDLMRG